VEKILEPSCGSGEFLLGIQKQFPQASITAIEKNPTIFESARPFFPTISFLNCDFLETNLQPDYSLIVGNPPFFVVPKNNVPEKYRKFMTGRPNIFVLFILHALELLAPGGFLLFVLPKNFLNCIYYDKARKHIHQHYRIVDIMDVSSQEKYLETQQPTFVLLVQKTTPDNSRFVLERSGFTFFNTPCTMDRIKTLYKGATTLQALGFKCSVGSVVWNQVKEKLTEDSSQTRLIYSGDMKNGHVVEKKSNNPAKKKYIHQQGTLTRVLLIERGFGKGTYRFDFCWVEEKKPFLIENHLLCITSDNPQADFSILTKSFQDPRTLEFIQAFFANNAMNCAEVENVLPIF
jgi:adenine-specific DNA-methyltransferase